LVQGTGGHLFLALTAEGVAKTWKTVATGTPENPWTDTVSMESATTDRDIVRIVLAGHVRAMSQIKDVVGQEMLPDDMGLVLEKGAAGILGHLKGLRSLAHRGSTPQTAPITPKYISGPWSVGDPGIHRSIVPSLAGSAREDLTKEDLTRKCPWDTSACCPSPLLEIHQKW